MMASSLLLPSGPELGTGSWSHTLSPRTELAIIDAAVMDRVLPGLPARLPVIPVDGATGLGQIRAVAEAIEYTDPCEVIAIGGGATMDLAKLAALTAERPALVDYLEHAADRCGLIPLAGIGRRRRLTLVPTTLGTGSESSSGACFDHQLVGFDGERARSLVVGAAVEADRAWLDPDLLTTLPLTLAREGALEALSRAVVSAVCTPSSLAASEWEAHMLVSHLREGLDDLIDGANPDLLHRIAFASTMTHRGLSLKGRGSAPSPIWFIATELSMIAGVRKNEALGALMGHWAHLVLTGHREWGESEVLAELWPLGSAGPAEVVSGWGLPTSIPLPDRGTERVIHRIERRWGGRLPMMRRFTTEQLETLLRLCTSEGSRA